MRDVHEFTLPDAAGQPEPLTRLGRATVAVCFAPPLAATACDTLLRSLADRLAEIEARDAALLVVVPATPEEAAAQSKRLELPFPLLADPSRAVGTAYGIMARGSTSFGPDTVGGLPGSFIVDQADTNPTVRFCVYGANPRLHPQLLVNALSRPVLRR